MTRHSLARLRTKVRNIVNGSAPLYAWADVFGGRAEPLNVLQRCCPLV